MHVCKRTCQYGTGDGPVSRSTDESPSVSVGIWLSSDNRFLAWPLSTSVCLWPIDNGWLCQGQLLSIPSIICIFHNTMRWVKWNDPSLHKEWRKIWSTWASRCETMLQAIAWGFSEMDNKAIASYLPLHVPQEISSALLIPGQPSHNVLQLQTNNVPFKRIVWLLQQIVKCKAIYTWLLVHSGKGENELPKDALYEGVFHLLSTKSMAP